MQLIVIIGSVITDRLLVSAVGTGRITDILVNVSKNMTRLRISNLAALGLSLAFIVWGVLYYIVFNKEYEIIALVALGLFLASAITLAVSRIGTYALIPLSQKFIEAGAPEGSTFQTLGDFLYHDVGEQGHDIHMLFTTLSLMMWNYLFYISWYIPKGLSVWGLVAIGLFLITVLLVVYNRDLHDSPVMILALAYAPY